MNFPNSSVSNPTDAPAPDVGSSLPQQEIGVSISGVIQLLDDADVLDDMEEVHPKQENILDRQMILYDRSNTPTSEPISESLSTDTSSENDMSDVHSIPDSSSSCGDDYQGGQQAQHDGELLEQQMSRSVSPQSLNGSVSPDTLSGFDSPHIHSEPGSPHMQVDAVSPTMLSGSTSPKLLSRSISLKSESFEMSLVNEVNLSELVNGLENVQITFSGLPTAPGEVMLKLVNSPHFRAFLSSSNEAAPPITMVISDGPSPNHRGNAWKFTCENLNQAGLVAVRMKVFVCNNPALPTCEQVTKDSGSMHHHQNTRNHGSPVVRCDRCGKAFKSGRHDVVKRHQANSCPPGRPRIQKKIAEAASKEAKKVKRVKLELKR